jgi:hypothetical protein
MLSSVSVVIAHRPPFVLMRRTGLHPALASMT